jgi:hypothetical protein
VTVLLNRFRVAQVIALSAAERTLVGPERELREADVAALIKAAYDEASESARAAFMLAVKPIPVAAWPWSAVRSVQPIRAATVGGIKGLTTTPPPGDRLVPAIMILLRGQVAAADRAGNELPDRGTPEAFLWEPLYRALDAWDTTTISQWIGPQGWMSTTASVEGATEGAVAGNNLPAVSTSTSTPIILTVAVTTTLTLMAVMTVRGLMGNGNETRRLEAQLHAVRERG